MFNFLFWLLVVLFTLRVIGSLIMPRLLRWFVFRIKRRMEEDYLKRENMHRASSDPQFEQEFFVNKKMKVKVPRKQAGAHRDDWEDGIESVEYEEVR
jgi:hypothetical protein